MLRSSWPRTASTRRRSRTARSRRADLARNAVGTDQVAAGSLLANDFKAGQLSAGPQGPKGDKGEKGEKGEKGVTSFAVRANAGQQPDAVTAPCNPGEVAVSGGAHSFDGVIDASAPVSIPTAVFTIGMPSFLGYTPTAWTGGAYNDARQRPRHRLGRLRYAMSTRPPQLTGDELHGPARPVRRARQNRLCGDHTGRAAASF